ncbi:hypothetical protein GH714_032624 [Hevea brasiliensis]|uniref:Glycosyltransferases n=1 Tax=Hevea brasiliensis TaxID=3981 RepID=A0A6A6L5I9_HEVBR|nr:hypothetical protein GH714_032624 [Hevea brasiliensis]
MLHLTGVMHSLMLVPYDVVWIVVEAGGVSNETASIIAKSGVKTIHVGFNQRMPNSWERRHKLEAKMRLRALRFVREQKLDGIVMFADDSNMHSMDLFDEIQNVKWFGAFPLGFLLIQVVPMSHHWLQLRRLRRDRQCPFRVLLVMHLTSSGWHTFNSLPYKGKNAIYIDDRATVLPQKLEWAGFVVNSRLLWKGAEDKPDWIKDLDSAGEDIESPLSLLKDTSIVEPLGSCGRQVLLWWLRVEARSDSKFPPGNWISFPGILTSATLCHLQMDNRPTFGNYGPIKTTPWPDVPPELPSTEKAVINIPEHTVKQTKTRSSRSKPRGKRKHEAKVVDTQISTRHSGQN